MRRVSITAYAVLIGIVCAAGLYAPYSHAGNVLLPADSSTSSPAMLPNLGLISGGSPAANPPMSMPPSSTTTIDPALQSTAVPQADTKEYVTSSVSATEASQLRIGVVPTHIIHVPDTSAAMPPNKNLPYAMNITLSSQSVFGSADVQTISNKLGLTSSQIGSSCILTPRGMLLTDKSAYVIYSSTGAQPITVGYDGMIKSYLLGAVALCAVDVRRLPPGSGYMSMVNNRLIIPLQPINCQTPTRQTSNMSITYNGTSSSHCSYN